MFFLRILRQWKQGIQEAGVNPSQWRNYSFRDWSRNGDRKCTHDLVSSVPHFLARLGLKSVANVEELIVKMLDGCLAMVGVIGRRVERSAEL